MLVPLYGLAFYFNYQVWPLSELTISRNGIRYFRWMQCRLCSILLLAYSFMIIYYKNRIYIGQHLWREYLEKNVKLQKKRIRNMTLSNKLCTSNRNPLTASWRISINGKFRIVWIWLVNEWVMRWHAGVH